MHTSLQSAAYVADSLHALGNLRRLPVTSDPLPMRGISTPHLSFFHTHSRLFPRTSGIYRDIHNQNLAGITFATAVWFQESGYLWRTRVPDRGIFMQLDCRVGIPKAT